MRTRQQRSSCFFALGTRRTRLFTCAARRFRVLRFSVDLGLGRRLRFLCRAATSSSRVGLLLLRTLARERWHGGTLARTLARWNVGTARRVRSGRAWMSNETRAKGQGRGPRMDGTVWMDYTTGQESRRCAFVRNAYLRTGLPSPLSPLALLLAALLRGRRRWRRWRLLVDHHALCPKARLRRRRQRRVG